MQQRATLGVQQLQRAWAGGSGRGGDDDVGCVDEGRAAAETTAGRRAGEYMRKGARMGTRLWQWWHSKETWTQPTEPVS